MSHHLQAFLIPFGLWTLLGWVLIARVFVTTLRAKSGNDPKTQAREVQKRFTRVGLVLMATLPIAFAAYYFLRA